MNRPWSCGSGNPGSADGRLFGPHMAEENPFDPDEIVVAEQWGSDVVLMHRETRRLRVLFGERGVPGGNGGKDRTRRNSRLGSEASQATSRCLLYLC